MLKWLLRLRKTAKPALLPGDQRQMPRHVFNYRRNVPIEVLLGISSWPALVRDLSQTGISLVVGQRHEPGTVLPACLKQFDRNLCLPMTLRVVHVTRRPDGYWLTGCRFEESMKPIDLKAIL